MLLARMLPMGIQSMQRKEMLRTVAAGTMAMRSTAMERGCHGGHVWGMGNVVARSIFSCSHTIPSHQPKQPMRSPLLSLFSVNHRPSQQQQQQHHQTRFMTVHMLRKKMAKLKQQGYKTIRLDSYYKPDKSIKGRVRRLQMKRKWIHNRRGTKDGDGKPKVKPHRKKSFSFFKPIYRKKNARPKPKYGY